MKIKVLAIALLLLFAAKLTHAQASINENLESAFLYVDTVKGSDSNPGTSAKPLKTIGKAASLAETNNRKKVGTRVTIMPGTYRESVTLGADSQDSTLPITFEASDTGSVIVSGADVYTGWKVDSGNSKLYTHSWSYKWGLCPLDGGCPTPEQDVLRRREMVIINGEVLEQVMSTAAMKPGTLYVNESASLIYVYPPTGTNMNSATVEVATRSGLFTITGKNDVVLRGLTFQYDNSCSNNSAVQVQGSSDNVLIDTDTFIYNNGRGLGIESPTKNVTVQYSTGNHNGSLGFHAYQTLNVLWQSNTTSYNNWRGAEGAYYGCNHEGALFFATHESTVNDHTAAYNQGHSIHWDTDNANITVSKMTSVHNFEEGALIESSEGPFTISDGHFCYNGQNAGISASAGISIRNSEEITLTANTFYDNGYNQLGIIGQKGGISVTNWQTGQHYTLVSQKLTQTQNTFEGQGSSQTVFSDSYLDGSDWTTFKDSLVSNNNTWWNSSYSNGFTVPSPTPGTKDTFSSWKGLTGQDKGSSWKQPGSTAGCNVSPDKSDFWLITTTPTITVNAGGKASFNATVVSLSFSGTVSLSSDGVSSISGASASWSQGSINSSGSATFTVTTKSSTPHGTHTVYMIGNSGSTTRMVALYLIVN